MFGFKVHMLVDFCHYLDINHEDRQRLANTKEALRFEVLRFHLVLKYEKQEYFGIANGLLHLRI